MVSIIVPAYNVEEYIDRCIESLVNQTYKDIEIIIINDGSKDGTPEKCETWAHKDSRIRYYSQENHGLGYVRNHGVDLTFGEYIMFVDSDDWVDLTIVDKLLCELIKTNSDIAVCDRYQIVTLSGRSEIICNDVDKIIDVHKNKKCIHEISTSAWAKLYRKSLIVDNNVKEPDHYYEDAVTPILIALSNKICNIKEPLYYYIYDREGSIINTTKSTSHLIKYLETLITGFKDYGLFEEFKSELQELVFKRIKWSLWNVQKNFSREKEQIIENFDTFCKVNFQQTFTEMQYISMSLREECFIWGSYNLMIISKMLMKMNGPEFPLNHVCFSSVISALDEDEDRSLNNYVISHDNVFRRYHLINEFKRVFLYKNKGEFVDNKYFLIDFLEERFDIVRFNDHYITLSDAFSSSMIGIEADKLYVLSESERRHLWTRKCHEFIELIGKNCPNTTIILVKMKLATCYGNNTCKHQFKELDRIEAINRRLDEYYEMFIELCPKAIVIDVETSNLFYTDEFYRHGCHPWHLNQYIYSETAKKIEEVIRQMTKKI